MATPNEIALLDGTSTESSAAITDELLQRLDKLLASTVLSFASLLPSFAGITAAAAAVAFDASWRYWIGALLSGLSMIPLAGYVPAIVKVVLTLILVDRQLDKIEALLPALRESPELLAKIHEAVGKYANKLAKFPRAAAVCSKVQRIMDQTAPQCMEISNLDSVKT